jgi:gas vesicle protein GvpL/GvpF
LEKKLGNLDLVAELAVCHEAVVEFFARTSGAAVVPMKMFTMFSSVERAVVEMRRRRTEIDLVLDRVGDCEEWGVRVTVSPRAVRAAPPRPRTGTAFLAARKQAQDAARSAVRKAADAASVAFSELSALAEDSRQRREVPPGAVAPLLDAAFLVSARNRSKFRAAAKRVARACARAGASLTLTGPWPAYNFVSISGD